MTQNQRPATRGRGAVTNEILRYAEHRREAIDDGWGADAPSPIATSVDIDHSREIISYNDSPDIPFDRSVNPYRGCEHGCIYCYARPSHAWLGLSPGLDFETRLFQKPDAAAQLERALAAPRYRPATLALGANTDPYQPIERRLTLTRAILRVLADCRHPVVVTTKSALVLRDREILAEMAAEGCAAVMISLTTLDLDLARRLEPRAATPTRRLAVIEALAKAGVPVGVLVAPVIPALTDADLERILDQAATAGAIRACSQLIRLPHEVGELFTQWLATHYPQRAAKVLGLIRQCRGGRLNDPAFVARHRGQGPIADLLRQRFLLAARRAGLATDPDGWRFETDRFRPPRGPQLSLFD
ncbi:PA0069 family radical SAM protein [Thioalkalicoccus limnaeus]|uniref:PA0069 family radical SAM protein n=1 Tax=Thioalkalicoccus limnaeus TaxID=120681 RepID=A0ABV4BHI7_9GAMM